MNSGNTGRILKPHTHKRAHPHARAHTDTHSPLPLVTDNKQSADYNCPPGSVAPVAVQMCVCVCVHALLYYGVLMVIKINDEGLMSPSKRHVCVCVCE